MGLLEEALLSSIKDENLNPKTTKSKNFKHWISVPDDRRCFICADSHGTIYYKKEKVQPKPPIHPFCRCEIIIMESIKSGTATINGLDGADW